MTKALLLTCAIAGGVLLAGCGGGNTDTANNPQSTASNAGTPPPATPPPGSSASTQPGDGSQPSNQSNATPPAKICGTLLVQSVAAPYVIDATAKPLQAETDTSLGGLLYIQAVAGCERGDTIKIDPATAAHIVTTAHTKDDLTAAVSIKPTADNFHVIGSGANPFDLTVALKPNSGAS